MVLTGPLGIGWHLEYFVRLYQNPIWHSSICSSAYAQSLTSMCLNLQVIFNVSIENICEQGTVNCSVMSLRHILSAEILEKLSGCSEGKHTGPLYSRCAVCVSSFCTCVWASKAKSVECRNSFIFPISLCSVL